MAPPTALLKEPALTSNFDDGRLDLDNTTDELDINAGDDVGFKADIAMQDITTESPLEGNVEVVDEEGRPTFAPIKDAVRQHRQSTGHLSLLSPFKARKLISLLWAGTGATSAQRITNGTDTAPQDDTPEAILAETLHTLGRAS